MTRSPRRYSKAALNRVKLGAVVLAAVAFVSSLAGVVIGNPGVKQAQAASPAQQTAVNIPNPPAPPRLNGRTGRSSQLVLPQMPQAPVIRPFARTRGS